MEHAIRKHCTVHHDEDPAFYKSLSEKVDALIERHQDEWDLLVEKLAELRHGSRGRTPAGRRWHEQGGDGLLRAHRSGGFASGAVPDADKPRSRRFMEVVVDLLQDTIGSIDFWQNPDKQKRVRGTDQNRDRQDRDRGNEAEPRARGSRDHEAGQETDTAN
jgi:type I restriction enzyme R subunit